MKIEHIATSLGLTEATIQDRLQMLQFTASDRHLLQETWREVVSKNDDYVDLFIARLLSNKALATIVSSERRVERLRVAHKQYVEQLFTAEIDNAYVLSRLTVGLQHHRLAVTPQWYLAAISHLICDHLEACFQASADLCDGVRRVVALIRAVFFDASLVLDAYGRSEAINLVDQLPTDDWQIEDFPQDVERGANTAVVTRDCRTPPIKQVRLDENEVQQRAEFIGLDRESVASVAMYSRDVVQSLSHTLEDFYRFVSAHAELASMVHSNGLDRLKLQVAAYWHELMDCRIDASYAASRMRIGVIHEQIGLEPQWYLAGLARQLSGILESLPGAIADPEDWIRTFIRIICFDITFVIDAYMDARAAALLHLRGFANHVMHGLSAAVAVTDSAGRVIFANESFVRLVSIEPAMIFFMKAADLLALPGLTTAFDKLVRGSLGRLRFLEAVGERTYRITLSEMVDQEHAGDRCVAVVLDDVSDLVRCGDTVDEEAQQYKRLLDAAPAMLWELNWTTRTILSVSQATERLIGYRDVTLLGRCNAWIDLIVSDDRGSFCEACASLASQPRASCDYRITTPTGKIIWLRSVLSRINASDGGLRIAAVTFDVTHSRQADQLRLTSLEHFASNVSRIVNNALTAISGNIQLSQSFHGETCHEDADSYLEEALSVVARASGVLSRLLEFSGKQAMCGQESNLGEVLRGSLSTFVELLGESQTLSLEVQPSLNTCHIDAQRFIAAVGQLIDNARRAMPSDGNVTIKVKNLDRSAMTSSGDVPSSHLSPLIRGWVEVSVEDNGCGMSDELRERAIEPFFPEVLPGGRYGLGLSMVHGFVSQSGGTMAIDSTPLCGSTIRLRFPYSYHELPALESLPTDAEADSVLIVDSDEDVVRSFARMISQHGCTILTALNSDQAIALATRQPVCVVVTEADVPGSMDGLSLASRLVAMHPNLGVVITVCCDRSTSDIVQVKEGWAVLRKPFLAKTLLSTISQVTNGRLCSAMDAEVLTTREREVLGFIAAGKTQSAVGEILGISERTVEQHIRAARRKLRANNTIHAVVEAIQRGEITP